MTAYHMDREDHVGLGTTHPSYPSSPPTDYRWAIRRADGSLVFRTETEPFAAQLLRRLLAQPSARKAAA